MLQSAVHLLFLVWEIFAHPLLVHSPVPTASHQSLYWGVLAHLIRLHEVSVALLLPAPVLLLLDLPHAVSPWVQYWGSFPGKLQIHDLSAGLLLLGDPLAISSVDAELLLPVVVSDRLSAAGPELWAVVVLMTAHVPDFQALLPVGSPALAAPEVWIPFVVASSPATVRHCQQTCILNLSSRVLLSSLSLETFGSSNM